MPGIIKLVGTKGGTIKSTYYFRKSDFKIIIEMWRRVYGLKFEKYFIHVVPSLKDQRRFTNPKNKNNVTKTEFTKD